MKRHRFIALAPLASLPTGCSDEETSVPGLELPPDAGPDASPPNGATLRALINYRHYASAHIGDGAEYPGDGNPGDFNPLSDMELVASESETVAGAIIEQAIIMPAALAGPRAEVTEAAGEALATIDARVEGSWVVRGAPFTDGRFIKRTRGATARFWLLDQGGYDAWVSGGPVQALAAADDASELRITNLEVPAEQPLWLVAYNSSLTSRLQVELDLQVAADTANR